jgi:type IV secretory pathway VirB4 component
MDSEPFSTDVAKEIIDTFYDAEPKVACPLAKKEYKALRRELKGKLKSAKREVKEANTYAKKTGVHTRRRPSLRKMLKKRDREMSASTRAQHKKRRRAKTTQDAIGYDLIYPDGLAQVESGLFSETLRFEDISYQSARDDTQRHIYGAMCALLDYFGEDTHLQFNVVNIPFLPNEVGTRSFFNVEAQESEKLKIYAREYNDILNSKMKEGISNIRRERYITYATRAATAEAALPTLARIRNDVVAALKNIRSEAALCSGKERLEAISSQVRPGKPFVFDWSDISLTSGLSTKDVLAPQSLDFTPSGDPSYFVSEGAFCQVLIMRHFGSELSDRALCDIIDLPFALNVSWHIQGMDKAKAVSFVRQRASWIDKEVIEEQRSAVKKGYDFTILPSVLKYSKEETQSVLRALQQGNQRLFAFTGLIYTWAHTLDELQDQCLQIIATARQNSIEVTTLDYLQRSALNSALPLGNNHLETTRLFTTEEAGILIPFATQELTQRGGHYYGQNKVSNNLVICNRKLLTSPMGFISGIPGSGKSFAVKNEIIETVLLNPADQVIIIDRSGEYAEHTRACDGEVLAFGPDAQVFLNPFDLADVAYKPLGAQISFKVDTILAQAQASAAQHKSALDEGDLSLLTSAVEKAYQKTRGAKVAPLLEDFVEILSSEAKGTRAHAKAEDLALRYKRHISQSQGFFNRQSTLCFDKKVIDISLKELPDSMLVFGLVAALDAIRNHMYANFSRGIRTWLYAEEIQSLFEYDAVINYFSRFTQEGRKFGLLQTGITQNAQALLAHPTGKSIILNADFCLLLRQSLEDKAGWSELLGLSPLEESYIDKGIKPGDGLLCAGAARVPFKGEFPKNTSLYRLFDTDPNEIGEQNKKSALS